jgi:hypothetical protein
MLKLKTDLKIKSRLVLRCSKHSRYSPERDGASAIRGGCATCTSILAAYQARERLLRAFKEFEVKTAEFEAVKPKQGRHTAEDAH